MARDRETAHTQNILAAIETTLDHGSSAALVTLVEGGAVGAKLLVREDGVSTGTLSAAELDSAAISFTPSFLASRHDARSVSLAEISTDSGTQAETRLLFERIAPEPRLIVCGGGACRCRARADGSPLGIPHHARG